jgi:hypothetical protein
MTRPAFPRTSSATSGFRFCGIIEEPVEKPSPSRTNPNSLVLQMHELLPDAASTVVATDRERSGELEDEVA